MIKVFAVLLGASEEVKRDALRTKAAARALHHSIRRTPNAERQTPNAFCCQWHFLIQLAQVYAGYRFRYSLC
jgi:hypothetical protein